MQEQLIPGFGHSYLLQDMEDVYDQVSVLWQGDISLKIIFPSAAATVTCLLCT